MFWNSRSYVFYGLEQILLERSIGWDAAMATKLEWGHEQTNGVLLLFGEAVFVILKHLIQVQWELRPMLIEQNNVWMEM